MLHFGLRLEPLNLLTALTAGYVLFTSCFSLLIKERIYLSETLVATLFGIIVGPAALGVLDLGDWGLSSYATLHQFSRMIIAVQVMIAGVSLPKHAPMHCMAYLWKERLSLFILLLPGMMYMWLVAAALCYAFLPVSFLQALLIGGCIAPTDPVLANSIVRGRFAEKHVPLHVRNILSAESGANDGLGYPYMFFAVLLMLRQDMGVSVGAAIGEWIYNVWLYQIGFSCVLGYVVGHAARVGLRYAHDHDWIDKESFLAFSFSFALFLMGSVAILGTDDLLAIFVAGNAFTWDDWFRVMTEESRIQEVIDMLFTSVYFVYFGCMIPWSSFAEIGLSSLVLLSLTVLLLRRLPMVLAMYKLIPAIVTRREALFAGWFGPIGAGAIFYALEADKVLREHNYSNNTTDQMLFPVVMWIVLSSVVVHGITVPLMKIGRHVRREVIVPLSRSVTEISRTSTATTARREGKFTMPRIFTRNKQVVTVGRIVHMHRSEDMPGPDEQLVLAREETDARETVINWADTPLKATNDPL